MLISSKERRARRDPLILLILLELLVLLQGQKERGGGLVNCSESRELVFASLNSRKSGSLNPAKNTDKVVVVVVALVV